MPPRTYDFSNVQSPDNAFLSGFGGGFKGTYGFIQNARAKNEDMGYKALLGKLLVLKQKEQLDQEGYGPDQGAGATLGAAGLGNQTQSGGGIVQQAAAGASAGGGGGEPHDFSVADGANPTLQPRSQAAKGLVGRALGALSGMFAGPSLPDISADLPTGRHASAAERLAGLQHGYKNEEDQLAYERAVNVEKMRAASELAVAQLRENGENARANATARRANAIETRQERSQTLGYFRQLFLDAHNQTQSLMRLLPRNDLQGAADARSPAEKQQAIDDYQNALGEERRYQRILELYGGAEDPALQGVLNANPAAGQGVSVGPITLAPPGGGGGGGGAGTKQPLTPAEKQQAQSDAGFRQFLMNKGYTSADWQ